MIISCLMKQSLRIFCLTILSLSTLMFNIDANALDKTAASCEKDAVATAITQVLAGGGGTVYIPAGTCTWTGASAKINVSSGRTKPLSIIGAGPTQTIINVSPEVAGPLFDFRQTTATNSVRFSGFRVNATGRTGTASLAGAIALYYMYSGNFQIDNCYFYGKFYPVVEIRYAIKGLINNCTFEDNDPYDGTPYGISLSGSSAGVPGVPPCIHTATNLDATDYANTNCYNAWDTWYETVDLPHPRAFDENFVPGGDDSIFMENNTFINTRGSVVTNWGSRMSLVFRHNTISQVNKVHNMLAFKPGIMWVEVYNNVLTFTGTGQQVPGFSIVSPRGGLFYNNTFNKVYPAGVPWGFKYGFGYMYTGQTQMKDVYIWNNTYNGCANISGEPRNGDDEAPAGGWLKSTADAPEIVGKNVTYFFRAPQAGERGYNYTPYTYPHPLVVGGVPVPTPSPPKNLRIINP